MTRTKSNTLSIGSISAGTTIPQEIADTILSSLESLTLRRADRAKLTKLRRELDDTGCAGHEFEQETVDEIVEELWEIAGNYTPEYCYFGMHSGDGADLGVWIDWDSVKNGESDGEICKLPEGVYPSELTSINSPFALFVNDHGNATLYRRAGRKWVEVWSVV